MMISELLASAGVLDGTTFPAWLVDHNQAESTISRKNVRADCGYLSMADYNPP